MIRSISAGLVEGELRRSVAITRPVSSTTPAATLVPPMSTPIVSAMISPHPIPGSAVGYAVVDDRGTRFDVLIRCRVSMRRTDPERDRIDSEWVTALSGW
jgi:hypothetical protein